MFQESTLKTDSRTFVYSKTFSTFISTASSHKTLFYDSNVKILCLNIRDHLFQAVYVCNRTTASTNVLPDGQRGICVFNIFIFMIHITVILKYNKSVPGEHYCLHH